MTETRRLDCWGCGFGFVRPIGPGRLPRWCSENCARTARKAARTANRRARVAQGREAAQEAYRASQEAALIRRYGLEGAALLLRKAQAPGPVAEYR